eukprot:COSAG06_NODE_5366_length_3525_cov_2.738471_2_plen_40_part_00
MQEVDDRYIRHRSKDTLLFNRYKIMHLIGFMYTLHLAPL